MPICPERLEAVRCELPTAVHDVFVYGTLRPEDGNGEVIKATHMLPGYQMYLIQGNFEFPAIAEADGEYVLGNIIVADDAKLKELDRYENIKSGLYSRVEVDVVPIGHDGAFHLNEPRMKAFVYVANNLIPKAIESGDWTKR